MFPPNGSTGAQGQELQIGTNCLGAFLLTDLLRPSLVETARISDPASVRVSWVGSLGIDVLAPTPGGMLFEEAQDAKPKVLGRNHDCGQSKVGNIFLASEAANRWGAKEGVVHLTFNPGNLKTGLNKTPGAYLMNLLLSYPPIYGAYTEHFCALSPTITVAQSGAYVHPWGRIGGFRGDIVPSLKSKEEGGNGKAAAFNTWCEKTVLPYR